jgi:hypothetical protein
MSYRRFSIAKLMCWKVNRLEMKEKKLSFIFLSRFLLEAARFFKVPIPGVKPTSIDLISYGPASNRRREGHRRLRSYFRQRYSAFLSENLGTYEEDIRSHKPAFYDHETHPIKDIFFQSLQFLSDYSFLMTLPYADELITVSELFQGKISQPPFSKKKMSLKSYLQNFQKPGFEYYLQQVDLDDELPDLIDEIGIERDLPFYLSNGESVWKEFIQSMTLFIGKKGIQTSLHYDRCCPVTKHDVNNQPRDPGIFNFFLQLSGKRKIILFPPHEYDEDLLPEIFSSDDEPVLTTWPHVSKSRAFIHSIEEHSSDPKEQLSFIQQSTFPSLAKAWSHRVEYILEAGDALLIPPRYWHASEILETSSAVNWWFFTEKEFQAAHS